MKVRIINQKAKAVYFNGDFLDTDKELDLSFSDAFRLSRICDIQTIWKQDEYDSSLFRDEKSFNFFGDVDSVSGFGGVSYNLLKHSNNYKIAAVGKSFSVNDPYITTLLNRPLQEKGAMVWHDQPREQWMYSPFKRNIAIVPFETTRVPRSWVGKINTFDALFVPCQQNIEMFRNSGVTIPIELIHWGIDEGVYSPLERSRSDETFTFGTMGALSIRKGTDILVQAFREAFPKEMDVKLICKTSYNGYPFMVNDKRIEVQMTPITQEELKKDFFQRVDCFVFPTRGEGFGLTPLEAMATGIPAIVTGWSGPVEYMTPKVGWTIDYTMEPAQNFTEVIYKEDCGEWALPKKDHLIELMRYAYSHRDEVKEKGRNATRHVKENWLWQDKIKLYHDALEKHL